MALVSSRLASEVKLDPVGLLLPDQISSLAAWWDASRLSGFSDSDPVSSWPDLTGNGYTFSQATGSLQPAYRVVDGVTFLRFSSDYMSVSSAPALTGFALLVVFSFHTLPSANTGIFSVGPTGGNDWNSSGGGFAFHYRGSGDAAEVVYFQNASEQIRLGDFEVGDPVRGAVVTLPSAGTPADAYRMPYGAVRNTANNWNAVSGNGMVVGTRWLSGAPSTNYCPIDVAEIALWQSPLTDRELAGLDQYVAQKYAGRI